MNEEQVKNADTHYRLAEQRAEEYLNILRNQVMKKTYVPTLLNDIQKWKQNHIHHSFFSFFTNHKGNMVSKGYQKYIGWLHSKGKLDEYLDRSISYIFMRDMGKSLDSIKTRTRIKRAVENVKIHLLSNDENQKHLFGIVNIYRWAQSEGIESTLIWLMNKLKTVSIHIPEKMDAEHAQRKLIKIIAGVTMNELEEMSEDITSDERKQKLSKAIKLGYSYGLTYPFIDDLLDSDVLSEQEKAHYSDMIRTTLVTGVVPRLGDWYGQNKNLIHFIHSELCEAFHYIKVNQKNGSMTSFLGQSYVFFRSQEVDRIKDLSNAHYSNEEIYVPVIIKSSSSRLIIRSIIGASEDEGYDNRTFFYGIYNQLSDDFADMFDDMKAGAVTPYTYYLKYHDSRPDLINPFELYWAVISHLIHHVYNSDPGTCEVILNRAINGLKRYKERMGSQKYNEVMKLFATSDQKFHRVIQMLVQKADNVDFLDKLIRDHMLSSLKEEREKKGQFLNTIESVRTEINDVLTIPKTESDRLVEETIVDAANYSLKSDGKRLRPIITWMIGNAYGLDQKAMVPLLKSLEYMHTASLIFDDLPSQDNASIRRGRPTVHEIYNVAIAELTGLLLTQKATEEQASLDQFHPKSVLRLIQYSARMTAEMCKGQAMDLESRGKSLTLEQLDRMCFYKTGVAFEASLIMPAILANVKDAEIAALKKYAYHAGIAFQIKDDLLDVEGELSLLGKKIGKDAENNHSTFVSILGQERARKAMWEHYCQAIEVLAELPQQISFLKYFMDYIVNRNH